jgi:threonine/homoserine/homoserine lactone efflux protein
MSIELILAFTTGMIILSASPGPGVFSTLAEALSNGFKSSMYFLTGLIIGDIIFLLLAVFGLSFISIALGEFFIVIKIIGGAYLIYLGIKMWKDSKFDFNINKSKNNKTKFQKMLAGLLVTLGNPKAIIFYASLLPTIIDLNNIKMIETFTIVFIVAIVSYAVIGTYSYLAVKAKLFIKDEKMVSKINKTAGAVMAGAGTYIIVK